MVDSSVDDGRGQRPDKWLPELTLRLKYQVMRFADTWRLKEAGDLEPK